MSYFLPVTTFLRPASASTLTTSWLVGPAVFPHYWSLGCAPSLNLESWFCDTGCHWHRLWDHFALNQIQIPFTDLYDSGDPKELWEPISLFLSFSETSTSHSKPARSCFPTTESSALNSWVGKPLSRSYPHWEDSCSRFGFLKPPLFPDYRQN